MRELLPFGSAADPVRRLLGTCPEDPKPRGGSASVSLGALGAAKACCRWTLLLMRERGSLWPSASASAKPGGGPSCALPLPLTRERGCLWAAAASARLGASPACACLLRRASLSRGAPTSCCAKPGWGLLELLEWGTAPCCCCWLLSSERPCCCSSGSSVAEPLGRERGPCSARPGAWGRSRRLLLGALKSVKAGKARPWAAEPRPGLRSRCELTVCARPVASLLVGCVCSAAATAGLLQDAKRCAACRSVAAVGSLGSAEHWRRAGEGDHAREGAQHASISACACVSALVVWGLQSAAQLIRADRQQLIEPGQGQTPRRAGRTGRSSARRRRAARCC